eukprot:TRINITY_DN2850_c0_g1_i1.p1 TRINITY_DN2850_c0_g1~~TRINITY_DN2850_c0_g1_i1.p1  ORF type:complete len:223 (+),score=42.96 TRINITY_DN2850_c0_g1_i1:28-669(+)
METELYFADLAVPLESLSYFRMESLESSRNGRGHCKQLLLLNETSDFLILCTPDPEDYEGKVVCIVCKSDDQERLSDFILDNDQFGLKLIENQINEEERSVPRAIIDSCLKLLIQSQLAKSSWFRTGETFKFCKGTFHQEECSAPFIDTTISISGDARICFSIDQVNLCRFRPLQVPQVVAEDESESFSYYLHSIAISGIRTDLSQTKITSSY